MSITFTAEIEGGPQVNMANGNAVDLFNLLGLTFDGDLGEASARDFLGRVLIAQALLDVTCDDVDGRPEVRDGNWTECGRRPGYLAGRLAELHEVADWAAQHEAVVVWG